MMNLATLLTTPLTSLFTTAHKAGKVGSQRLSTYSLCTTYITAARYEAGAGANTWTGGRRKRSKPRYRGPVGANKNHKALEIEFLRNKTGELEMTEHEDHDSELEAARDRRRTAAGGRNGGADRLPCR